MHENTLLFEVTLLIMQLAVIIFSSWGITQVCYKLKLPTVIGYIIVGIILGPFLLGSIPLPYFPDGIFMQYPGNIPISPVLYSLSSIAAILLLYLSGLETDMALFIRYIGKGSIVGLGGLIVSFIGGYFVSYLLIDLHYLHPSHLFMGTIATATSVGISTSVLSSKQKINSPEGVTILSAAVLDDVLGIIVLAIVVGLTTTLKEQSFIDLKLLIEIAIVAAKAIGLWVGCTAIGIIFSRKIGSSIKKIFKDATSITLVSMGLALVMGGIFEIMGLSMVIGAYIVGLSLSNTDLSYVIQEKIQPIAAWIIPIFFIVTGMTINISELLNWQTLVFGSIYALVCIVSKIIGAGVPAFFMGFNPLGAIRIGIGMAPRGEIALIIASLGVSIGIVDDQLLGAVLIMIVASSLIAPFILDKLLSIETPGIKQNTSDELTKTEFNFNNSNLTRLILLDFLQLIDDEHFFINQIIHNERTIYHIRKDNVFITLSVKDNTLIFYTEKSSISFIKTALYEATGNIAESAAKIKETLDPKTVLTSETTSLANTNLSEFLDPALVSLHINSNTKTEIITELSEMLNQLGLLKNKDKFIAEVLEREKTFSTGLQEGIALPHAKSDEVLKTKIVIGLKSEGTDFDSLDGKPSNIFILIASQKDTPHLSILTQISTLLNSEKFRIQLLNSTKIVDIIELFKQRPVLPTHSKSKNINKI